MTLIYVPAAAGVGALAPAPLYVPAGSVVGALAPAATVSAGRIDNLRRGGGRPGDRNIGARRRRRRQARPGTAVSAGRIDRRACSRPLAACCSSSFAKIDTDRPSTEPTPAARLFAGATQVRVVAMSTETSRTGRSQSGQDYSGMRPQM